MSTAYARPLRTNDKCLMIGLETIRVPQWEGAIWKADAIRAIMLHPYAFKDDGSLTLVVRLGSEERIIKEIESIPEVGE